jgi:hypothetical protein
MQQNRQNQQDQLQKNSQQNQQNMQEGRQEAYEDAHWSGGYYAHPTGAVAAATVIAAGTAVTMSTMQAMTTPSGAQPAACTMTSVTVSGVNYYRCGPNWFEKAYVQGELAYVAVTPPPGA